MSKLPNTLPVDELFGPTVAGEGSAVGQRTMFVRLGACDGVDGRGNLCTWCDSLTAADSRHKREWRSLTPDQIVSELIKLAPHCRQVTISGGNPVLYDLESLVVQLHEAEYSIDVETQGTRFQPWLLDVERVTISPKPPSAGFTYPRALLTQIMEQGFYAPRVVLDLPELVLKLVVDPHSPADYEFASSIITEYDPYFTRVYLSVLTAPDDDAPTLLRNWLSLVEQVKADARMPDVAVLPQCHVLLFGHGRGK